MQPNVCLEGPREVSDPAAQGLSTQRNVHHVLKYQNARYTGRDHRACIGVRHVARKQETRKVKECREGLSCLHVFNHVIAPVCKLWPEGQIQAKKSFYI